MNRLAPATYEFTLMTGWTALSEMKATVPRKVLTVSLVESRIGLISFCSRIRQKGELYDQDDERRPDDQCFERHEYNENITDFGGCNRIGTNE